MSAPEEREQNWYPVSQVGWFTAHIRVHQEQAGDLVYFQNQADKWKALPDLELGLEALLRGWQ